MSFPQRLFHCSTESIWPRALATGRGFGLGPFIPKRAGGVARITQSGKAVTSALRPYEGSKLSRPSGAGLFGALT